MTTTIPKYKGEDDPFYRYKREIVSLSRGVGKGGSVVWSNFGKVCGQLNRSPKTIGSYMAKRLGAKVTCKDETLVIFKVVSVKDVEDLLEKYVLMSVVCKRCENPETDEKTMYCEACGFHPK